MEPHLFCMDAARGRAGDQLQDAEVNRLGMSVTSRQNVIAIAGVLAGEPA